MRKRRNGPGAITPLLAARVLELSKDGKGSTAIVRELDGAVTRQAVDAFLKRQRPKATTSPRKEPKARPEPTSKEVEAVLDEGLEGGSVDVQRRLGKTSKLLDQLETDVLAGAINPATFVALAKLEADLAERLEAMRPPVPPDPEADVANRAAAERLITKMDRQVRAAEERARCQNCGERPW